MTSTEGIGLGVGVGAGVCTGFCVTTGVGVGFGVGVGVGVGTGVGVGVAVGTGVGEGVGVGVGVSVGANVISGTAETVKSSVCGNDEATAAAVALSVAIPLPLSFLSLQPKSIAPDRTVIPTATTALLTDFSLHIIYHLLRLILITMQPTIFFIIIKRHTCGNEPADWPGHPYTRRIEKP